MKTAFLRILFSESNQRYFFSAVLTSVFIFAGISKLADPSAFAEDIQQYRLLPLGWVAFVASCLPWFEIFIGTAFWVRPFRLSASFLILVLMGIFTLAVVSALVRGLDISCGCFGKAFREYAGSGTTFLLRDLLLLIASIWLFFRMLREEISVSMNPTTVQ